MAGPLAPAGLEQVLEDCLVSHEDLSRQFGFGDLQHAPGLEEVPWTARLYCMGDAVVARYRAAMPSSEMP